MGRDTSIGGGCCGSNSQYSAILLSGARPPGMVTVYTSLLDIQPCAARARRCSESQTGDSGPLSLSALALPHANSHFSRITAQIRWGALVFVDADVARAGVKSGGSCVVVYARLFFHFGCPRTRTSSSPTMARLAPTLALLLLAVALAPAAAAPQEDAVTRMGPGAKRLSPRLVEKPLEFSAQMRAAPGVAAPLPTPLGHSSGYFKLNRTSAAEMFYFYFKAGAYTRSLFSST